MSRLYMVLMIRMHQSHKRPKMRSTYLKSSDLVSMTKSGFFHSAPKRLSDKALSPSTPYV